MPDQTPQESYTILELEGLYTDTTIEDQVFARARPDGSTARVRLVRANLAPGGEGAQQPLTDIDDELCKSVDGLMVFRHYIKDKDLDRFPNLKAVVRMGVGYDRLDRQAMASRGITVSNVPAYGTNEVADHAIALMLALRRGIVLHHERQRATPPAPWSSIDHPLVTRLQGATFGLLGLGRIGTATALRAKAFGCRVVFYDPFVSHGTDKALQISRVSSLRELFSQSSILSVHCPNTKQTRRIVSDELLELMPPGAVLINTARGETVDLDAVERALRSGRLAGAGLDVLEREPVPDPAPSLVQAYRNREPWLDGRLVLTPHSAFFSPESFQDIRVMAAETIKSTLIDGVPMNVVHPDQE